ncbi:MAG: hypothetical protein IPJ65_41615 [Archangiaceae bacterium]|nr:hypothetical protein [Archangiaceae bacterium]
MSLALFRERLEAGEVDAQVRAHLRSCDECRAHYDLLAQTARALGDDGAKAERERLFLNHPSPLVGEGRGEGARAGSHRRVLAIALAAGILLVAGVSLVLPPRATTPEVQLRGSGDATAAPFSLRVYGKDAPGQKVRLIADLPGAKEASVNPRAELQLFVKPAPKPGEVLLVELRAPLKSASLRSGPGDDLAPVGSAFGVGGFGPQARIEVCAALAPQATPTLAAALEAGSTQYCSTLLVTP